MKRLIVLAILLLSTSPAFAAITFVNQVSAGSTGGNAVTTGQIDMTSGGDANLIVLAVAYYQVGTGLTVTDSSSNVYTALTAYCNAASACVQLYYKQAPTVTSTMTFTVSGNNIYPSVAAIGFRGVAATPADQENGATGSSITTLQPGSITPTENNEVIVAATAFSASTTVAINASFVDPPYQVNYLDANHFGVAASYLIQGMAAAVNPTLDFNSVSLTAAATQSSFKETGGAGGTGYSLPQGFVRP